MSVDYYGDCDGGMVMNKDKNQITIRSSAAEYLTFVASTGNSDESVEMRYEDVSAGI